MFGKLSRRSRKRLEKKGRTAPATVLDIADWGPTITHGEGPSKERDLALTATLRVEPPSEAPFEVSGRFRFPKQAVPEKGGRVSVVYDPENHDDVMLEELTMSEADLGAGIAGTGLGSGRRLDQPAQQDAMQEAQAWIDAFNPGAGGVPGAPAGDPVEELARLSRLKEQGQLTEAEFEAEKGKLLGG